jgi:hypothetical protein
MTKHHQAVVVGEGFGALLSLTFLKKIKGLDDVLWIPGSGARLMPPVPMFEMGHEWVLWKALLAHGLDFGTPMGGQSLREFKNKSFRVPAWAKASAIESEMRAELRNAEVTHFERWFVPSLEVSFSASLTEIELKLRESVLAMGVPRLEGVPVEEIEHLKAERKSVLKLGSGESVSTDLLIYADMLWVKGLPKSASRKGVSAIQAIFEHTLDGPDVSLEAGFWAPLTRDAGEEFPPCVWGHFFDQGKRSIWTTFVGEEQSEDNHEISKKLRKMKAAFEKMFENVKIVSESVRFEANVLAAAGEPTKEADVLSGVSSFKLVQERFGLNVVLAQIGELFELSEVGGNPGLTSQLEPDEETAEVTLSVE